MGTNAASRRLPPCANSLAILSVLAKNKRANTFARDAHESAVAIVSARSGPGAGRLGRRGVVMRLAGVLGGRIRRRFAWRSGDADARRRSAPSLSRRHDQSVGSCKNRAGMAAGVVDPAVRRTAGDAIGIQMAGGRPARRSDRIGRAGDRNKRRGRLRILRGSSRLRSASANRRRRAAGSSAHRSRRAVFSAIRGVSSSRKKPGARRRSGSARRGARRTRRTAGDAGRTGAFPFAGRDARFRRIRRRPR
ncbi:MAG: hypothetical protein BWZ10_02547 [candidate division BRC1 bacterium ADurb.BinA364]|nr:MAG: hypothetical protein BWZ10_02547 [candidate division BRC1 bacterium ADurb.BinA364]